MSCSDKKQCTYPHHAGAFGSTRPGAHNSRPSCWGGLRISDPPSRISDPPSSISDPPSNGNSSTFRCFSSSFWRLSGTDFGCAGAGARQPPPCTVRSTFRRSDFPPTPPFFPLLELLAEACGSAKRAVLNSFREPLFFEVTPILRRPFSGNENRI